MKPKLTEWILEANILSMQNAMESGELCSEKLVQAYIDRIHAYDPTINSVLEINPEALEIARALDQERKQQGSRGPLHGIPILLKDNIDTGDRMHTSAGSIALADSCASQDSFIAAKLRSAGAVLLGKTNMTEWANFMSNTMWAGYSSRGGQVLNPYGPGEFFVGGSSSGSGASIAANLAAAAIGTETSGSIISPASHNYLVGLKPTVGLLSRSGIIPISSTQDTPGPMTRTVADTAVLLGAMTGVDEKDTATLWSQDRTLKDYTHFLDKGYLKQARIGIPRYYYRNLDPERLALMEAAIDVLRREGATLIDEVTLPCEQVTWDAEVLRYEFKKGINDYLSKLPDSIPVHSLTELIEFNEQHAEKALKYGQTRLTWCEETDGTLKDPVYLESLQRNMQFARTQGIDYALEHYKLDALLFPCTYDGYQLSARAGYPSITVPAGYCEVGITTPEGWSTKGPFGIVFAGAAFSEGTLISLAYGYEQATLHRFNPKLG